MKMSFNPEIEHNFNSFQLLLVKTRIIYDTMLHSNMNF